MVFEGPPAAPDPAAYHARKRLYRLLLLFLKPLALWAFWAWGLSSGLWSASRSAVPPALQWTVYLVALEIALVLAASPLSYLSGYLLEKRYGMMRLTPWAWIGRWVKAHTIGVTLFALCGTVLYALLEQGGRWWWLSAGAFLATGSLALTWGYPMFILPLFHRMPPLPPGDLRERLTRLCGEAGLRRVDLRQIDLSRISRRANAAVMGLGPTRRIVLSDTLLRAFSAEEIEFVLHHEIAHDRERHIFWQSLWSVVSIFLLMWVIDRSIAWSPDQVGIDLRDPAQAPLLLLALYIADLLGLPLINGISRWLERRADAYALRRQRSLPTALSALTKLCELNLAHPSPPAWEERVFYTHPSLPNRLKHARQVLGA